VSQICESRDLFLCAILYEICLWIAFSREGVQWDIQSYLLRPREKKVSTAVRGEERERKKERESSTVSLSFAFTLRLKVVQQRQHRYLFPYTLESASVQSSIPSNAATSYFHSLSKQ
jgi:hypothetical protein